MRYELKAIFRSRITWVVVLITALICISTVISHENDIASYYNYDTSLKLMEYSVEQSRQELHEFEAMNVPYLIKTKKQKIWIENMIAYSRYFLGEQEKQLEILKKEGRSERFQESYQKLELMSMLIDYNMASYPNEGYPTIDKVLPEEYAYCSEHYQFDALPFDIREISGKLFETAEQKKALLKQRDFQTMLLKNYIGQLMRGEKLITFMDRSPYAFLGRLFCMQSTPSLLFGMITLLFSAAVVMEARKSGSYRLGALRPEKKAKGFFHYYGSALLAMALIFGVIIGGFLLMYTAKGGTDGLKQTMFVKTGNFSSVTPYSEHLDGSGTSCLQKFYFDEEFHYDPDHPILVITGEYEKIPMWQFLLAAGILAVLKWLFLAMLGVGIGILGRKNGRIILGLVLAAAVYGISQFSGFAGRFNPFAVTSAWNVTTGGETATWLGAVLVLSVSAAALLALILFADRKMDEVS